MSGTSPGSPDRIRTGVTALRGRRPRPLDDGAVHGIDTTAGVPGLEPRLTGPEPVGLPITPYPTGTRHRTAAPTQSSGRNSRRPTRAEVRREDLAPSQRIDDGQADGGVQPE